MDEFKPEGDLKPDPSDRRPSRSRKPDEFDNEPQINFDDVDLDADDRRPTRSRRAGDDVEEYDAESELALESAERRPPRGRKKSAAPKTPVSRQHLMMGIGILVLLLLIVGIGSALKAPSSGSESAGQQPAAEKNIDLSAQNGGTSTGPVSEAPQGTASVNGQPEPRDISLPPISSTPTQAQSQPQPEGQQRVEIQGDLNSALTQQQGQINSAISGSTLPMEPATVAAVGARKTAPRQVSEAREQPVRQPTQRTERKKVVIEPEHKTQPKQQVTAKRNEPVTAPAAQVKTPAAAPKSTATATAPKAPVTAAKPAATASAGAISGDASAIKSAPGSHYTLQLSSSSNSANLNAWAKKENLRNYMVYQTVRNGQPWYVLVSGVYPSREDAKRAVSTLPADVQAKNPWAKPIHQVQSDLK